MLTVWVQWRFYGKLGQSAPWFIFTIALCCYIDCVLAYLLWMLMLSPLSCILPIFCCCTFVVSVFGCWHWKTVTIVCQLPWSLWWWYKTLLLEGHAASKNLLQLSLKGFWVTPPSLWWLQKNKASFVNVLRYFIQHICIGLVSCCCKLYCQYYYFNQKLNSCSGSCNNSSYVSDDIVLGRPGRPQGTE